MWVNHTGCNQPRQQTESKHSWHCQPMTTDRWEAAPNGPAFPMALPCGSDRRSPPSPQASHWTEKWRGSCVSPQKGHWLHHLELWIGVLFLPQEMGSTAMGTLKTICFIIKYIKDYTNRCLFYNQKWSTIEIKFVSCQIWIFCLSGLQKSWVTPTDCPVRMYNNDVSEAGVFRRCNKSAIR